MTKRVSMQSRVLSSILIGLLFFVAAISLWLYRTGKLGISADVLVNQKRVTMNFDELAPGTYPAWQFTHLADQYQNYGIKFSTGGPYAVVSTPPTGPFSGTPNGVPYVIVYSQEWATAAKIPNPTSLPNGIAASDAVHIYGGGNAVPSPTHSIFLNFYDPADPAKPSTTGYVKFNLNVTMPTSNCPIGGLGGSCSTPLSVKVIAYGTNGNTLGTQEFTTTGTHSVEVIASGIAQVAIQRTTSVPSPTQEIIIPDQDAPQFVIDDLQFDLPASSTTATTPSGTLVTDKPAYAAGDTVTATLINTGTSTISCTSSQLSGGAQSLPIFYPHFVVTNTSGATVYTYPPAATSQNLQSANGTGSGTDRPWNAIAPGAQAVVATWNQLDTNNTQVPNGTYVMRELGCGQNFQPSATFTIGATTTQAVDSTLTTSKATYQTSETVSFTLKNTGQATITCPNGAPYMIADSAGKAVFSPTATQAVETLSAGQSKTWTWDQKKTDSSAVPVGSYVVTVTCGTVVKSASFGIASGTPQSLDFSVSPTEGPAPLSVTATYSGSETCLSWDFGDGTVIPSSPATQTHLYVKEGTYTITLRSCSGALGTKSVTVKKPNATTQSTPTPTLTNTTATGPTISNATASGTGGTTATSPATLVATGGSLPVNLAIAALLSALVGWLLFRRSRV